MLPWIFLIMFVRYGKTKPNKYSRWCAVQKDDIKYVTLIQNPLVQFRQDITRHSVYIPSELHICRPANPEVTLVVACHCWVLLVARSLTHCLRNHKMMVTSKLEKISRQQTTLALLLIHRLKLILVHVLYQKSVVGNNLSKSKHKIGQNTPLYAVSIYAYLCHTNPRWWYTWLEQHYW